MVFSREYTRTSITKNVSSVTQAGISKFSLCNSSAVQSDLELTLHLVENTQADWTCSVPRTKVNVEVYKNIRTQQST